MLVLRRQVFKSGLPHRSCSRVTGASLFGSLIPANSKTARRSRQFPAIALGIAASAGWIRSYSFEFPTLSEDGSRGFFRSFGAGLFSGSVPRLAPWAAFSPLRGWVCRCASLRGVLLCGSWLGLGFSLDGCCRGLAGGGARATGFDWGVEFGVFDQELAGVVWASRTIGCSLAR